MAFADRLKQRRVATGLTQGQLAAKLGITPSAVANYENGVSTPKAEVLFLVFNALGCDANFLFQDEMAAGGRAVYTLEEEELVRLWRQTDDFGRGTVQVVLQREVQRAAAQTPPPPPAGAVAQPAGGAPFLYAAYGNTPQSPGAATRNAAVIAALQQQLLEGDDEG